MKYNYYSLFYAFKQFLKTSVGNIGHCNSSFRDSV